MNDAKFETLKSKYAKNLPQPKVESSDSNVWDIDPRVIQHEEILNELAKSKTFEEEKELSELLQRIVQDPMQVDDDDLQMKEEIQCYPIPVAQSPPIMPLYEDIDQVPKQAAAQIPQSNEEMIIQKLMQEIGYDRLRKQEKKLEESLRHQL